MSHPGLHQIGEVSGRVGLSLRTIRYYEEMGLIHPAQRTDGGFRLYSEDDIDRLALIKHIKPLGLSVQAMSELLEARDTLTDPSADAPAATTAMATLARLCREAAERVDLLKGQLAQAEEFSAQLRREVRRHQRRVPGRA